MTHAQIAAAARKPYADKIAAMVREREMLADALQWLIECADSNNDGELDRTKDVEHAVNRARAVLARINYR